MLSTYIIISQLYHSSAVRRYNSFVQSSPRTQFSTNRSKHRLRFRQAGLFTCSRAGFCIYTNRFFNFSFFFVNFYGQL